MESSDRERRPSEVLKRGYSDEEVQSIYALGKLFLESGDLRKAEVLFGGLTEIAPDFAAGWLGHAYVYASGRNFDQAIYCARQALRINPDLIEATLYLIALFLTTRDYNSAGTYLGEVGERVESGSVQSQELIRFYKGQLARYQSRA